MAIGSILNTDEHSHIEPVRYPAGSNFWRTQMMPMNDGGPLRQRIRQAIGQILANPLDFARLLTVPDWARQTQILLFMQTLSSTLRLVRAPWGLRTVMEQGPAPSAFTPASRRLARQFAEIVGGTPTALASESALGIPTTAHILGGCVMGRNSSEGVIDIHNRVFGYRHMYVCDGSMISANPGVNPSLTITALTERAMAAVPKKSQANDDW